MVEVSQASFQAPDPYIFYLLCSRISKAHECLKETKDEGTSSERFCALETAIKLSLDKPLRFLRQTSAFTGTKVNLYRRQGRPLQQAPLERFTLHLPPLSSYQSTSPNESTHQPPQNKHPPPSKRTAPTKGSYMGGDPKVFAKPRGLISVPRKSSIKLRLPAVQKGFHPHLTRVRGRSCSYKLFFLDLS